MGLFSLTQELAIDLGTANTLIIYNGKVVVDEPSIVALDVHTGKVDHGKRFSPGDTRGCLFSFAGNTICGAYGKY